jgi:hypothetical protein
MRLETPLQDVRPWTPTVARVRDAILSHNYIAMDPPGFPELRSLMSPTQKEVDAMGDDLTAACQGGRFIDFGVVPNTVIQRQGERGARLYARRFIGQPFMTPWIFMHRWEGLAPPGMEKWVEGREAVAIYCVQATTDDPCGQCEVVELEPMTINGRDMLVFGDRALLIECYEEDPDNANHGKYYARAVPGIWRVMDAMRRAEDPAQAPEAYINAAKGAGGNLLDPLMTALLILNTNGIDRRTIEAPVKLNKQRAKHGKFAIPAYDIINTEPYVTAILRRGQPRVRGEDQGGTHAAPEMHYRMGFDRTLRSGKTSWVRDTLVNATDEARAAFVANRGAQMRRSHYEVRQ